MQQNKKKNLLGFVRALVFTVIFALLFVQGANMLLPKVRDDATGRPVNMITSCKVMDKNSVDLIIIGNSNAYRGINPMKIWMDTGISSCLIGHSFISETELYFRTKDILKYQSPKYIVLETDCMFETENIFENEKDAELLAVDEKEEKEDDKFGISKVQTKLDDAESEIFAAIDSRVPLMKFNYRWKQIDMKELKNTTTERAFTSRGFLTSHKTKPFVHSDYMGENNGELEPIEDISLKYFNKILNLCKENDIQLALVTVPSGNTWNWKKHNTVAKLAEENGLSYVDFNTDTDLIPTFDWKEDTKDAGNHLNNKGASKVTKAFEKIIKEDYGLNPSDLTEEQIEKLNTDTEIFYEKNFKCPKEKTREILEKNQNKFYK